MKIWIAQYTGTQDTSESVVIFTSDPTPQELEDQQLPGYLCGSVYEFEQIGGPRATMLPTDRNLQAE